MTYTVGTGFSGIGVPDLCARLLGMRTLWQIEKDAFCQKVLRKNFPEVETLYGDIFDAHPCYVDLAIFGFPCQPFSGAGKQLGERDPRYLVPEMLRVIDECKPRVVLLENVPGFTSLDDGYSFKNLLQALAEMGLDAEWGHIRASDVGAPHQRERWFCVAYAKGNGDRGNSRFMARAQSATQDDGARIERGCQDVAYASSERPGIGAATSDRCPINQQRDVAQGQPRWDRFKPRSGAYGAGLGYTHSSGWGEQRASITVPAQQSAAQCASRGDRAETQPRLGRIIDGVANGVDGFRPYPSRPGEPQYAFEPPRVTTDTPDRAKRLKALGNSMAVDVLYEVILSIRTWLETQDGVK